MNSSFQSNFSATSQLSLKSVTDKAPFELLGYVYDIPHEMKSAEIQQLFTEQHIDCIAQIKRDPKKPYDLAIVKFQNAAHV